MQAETGPAHFLADFETHAPGMPGADLPWLSDARGTAIQRFAASGFPGAREEDWKYTRIAPIEKGAFRIASPATGAVAAATIGPALLEDVTCHRLVFVDGRFDPALSALEDAPEGVEVMSMAEAIDQRPDLIENNLDRLMSGAERGFGALNAAFLCDGAVVRLARMTHLENPIHLLFVSTGRVEDVVAHPRILIIAEACSRGAVIESYLGLGDARYLNNVVTDVVLGEGAHVEHFKLQRESERAFHVASLSVRQPRDSRFYSHSVSLGGLLVRNDINASLDAEGASCGLDGLFWADGRRHVDFHTRVDHARPHGTSDEHYKGILSGRARGVFNGQVHVHPDAQRSDARQKSDNLLLTRNAEIDTKPQLEIHANDVKCTHGATIGQLDEDAIFYLRARGMDAESARSLLTFGFAREIVDRIEIIALREHVASALLDYLPDAQSLRGVLQ